MLDFRIAFLNLKSTALRTVLAMLGILVGTASVVAMVSTGEMASQAALDQFKTLGTDLIAISIYAGEDSHDQAGQKFSLKDAAGIQTASKDIEIVAPYTIVSAPISYRGNPINGSIIGATSELADVVHINMQAGRFISPLDHYEKYCIIGNQIYETLKATGGDPLNQLIKLGDHIFVIIGVARSWPENSFLYQDINNSVIVPIKTSDFLSAFVSINDIVMRLHPNANINQVKTSLEQYVHEKAPQRKLFFS